MLWGFGLFLLATSLQAQGLLDSNEAERVRRYIETKKACSEVLKALDLFLQDGGVNLPKISSAFSIQSYNKAQNQLSKMYRVLLSYVESPRLKARLALASKKAALSHITRMENNRLLEMGRTNEAPCFQYDCIRGDHLKSLFSALFFALKIQAELTLDFKSDPVFSYQHSSAQAKTWVWKFDRQREESTNFFRPKALQFLNPLSDAFRKKQDRPFPFLKVKQSKY